MVDVATGSDNSVLVLTTIGLSKINFIENVLGFHEINAAEKRVVWIKYREGRHGIKRLRFGTVVTDIIGDRNTIEVNSNDPYTLVVNEKEYQINKGKTVLKLQIE